MYRLSDNVLKRTISVIVLLAIFISCCSPYVRAENEQKSKEDDDQLVIVSLGDSYSSGEGIEPFYGQDEDVSEKVYNPDWVAHRSTLSWPGQLFDPDNEIPMSEYKDQYWYFVAASGATTEELYHPFEKEYNKGYGIKGIHSLAPQLDIFDSIEKNTVDYVTITIGGNDVDFEGIVKSCIFGSETLNIGSVTDKLENLWDEFTAQGGIREKLINAYTAISEKAGPQAHIIVAGYPRLFDSSSALLPCSQTEAGKVNYNVTKFNNAIEQIVEELSQNGLNISFVSVEAAFSGHQAFSLDPYITGLVILSRPEDLGFSFVSASTMHPNEKGAQAYAECVQERISEIEGEKNNNIPSIGEDDLTNNPEATDDELTSDALHYSGVILKPEDVVLKMFDALQAGDYEEAAECLDPATEQQFDFWGGIASTVVGLFTGDYMSWGQLLLESAGATNVEVIECYSKNYTIESNLDIVNALFPIIPGIKELFCTDADVYVKYRYEYNGVYYVQEDVYHVRRYELSGWRIEGQS